MGRADLFGGCSPSSCLIRPGSASPRSRKMIATRKALGGRASPPGLGFDGEALSNPRLGKVGGAWSRCYRGSPGRLFAIGGYLCRGIGLGEGGRTESKRRPVRRNGDETGTGPVHQEASSRQYSGFLAHRSTRRPVWGGQCAGPADAIRSRPHQTPSLHPPLSRPQDT